MNGITSEMLKAEGDCVYAFPGIKLAFNGDHREVLEDWKNGSVVKLESHLKRDLLGMFSVQSSVRPVRDAIGCRLALAFRPGSCRVPGGVKGRSWQVPGWYACGWYVMDCQVNLCMQLNRYTETRSVVYGRLRESRYSWWFEDGSSKIVSCHRSSFPWLSTGYLGSNRRKGPGVKWVPETKFADLDFADDIAENARDLQPLVTNIARLQAALGSASGPSINMLIGTHAPLRSVTIDENKLKVAENFTYLGSSTNNKGQMDNELDCRLEKASAAFNQLDFETYYVEISQEKRLESLHASDSECVRKILSIRRQDFIPNTDI
ncbi:hypothetical protein Bbelb_036650 [Branchiostoma belcheri]|nr:hypothetical protein Bbelb_036650 [Branchiostoma belcheri]